ncbi:SDR family oxidoreductase [Hoeflea sp. G2-23]|uniref:SDR family oxidoreductase n=1 Tax=Hoeflea algicola TaxID=2983763 RepID=A0ABT3ZCC3_9HYPH|nr:SDR family NAD(P)-dependent oxidoreductase [Hoeflea algicola]MCY0149281.1 SDR family oxidoreductase [Hoeflea algicola]
MGINIFSLTGRTAVVTGGSRGIGAAIVELFLRYGAKVVFCHARDDAEAQALTARLAGEGLSVSGQECDVADEAAVAAFAQFAKAELGHVDILVNSAGVSGDKAFEAITVADFDHMIDINLRGTFLMTQAFFSEMVERKFGRVINLASQLAYKGAPAMAHYCASKGGVVGFTRALSYDGAPHGVTVNAIAPGPIETAQLAGMTDGWRRLKHAELPIGRFGTVDEIAPVALLLASAAGSYFVGQTLSPNGGDVML